MAKKAKKRNKKKPSANGQTDRDNSGQFTNGNKAAVGNEKNTDRKSKDLKKALLDAVTEEDITAIAKKLIAKAKKGEVLAIRELFDRLWGRAKQEIEGEINVIQKSKTLTLEEMKERILEAEKAGTGIDQRSIEGGKTS